MGLAARLKQIELKLRPVTIVPERLFDIDQCIVHLGLDPVAVRESARNIGRSIVEVICEVNGIEPREFQHLLKEKINLMR